VKASRRMVVIAASVAVLLVVLVVARQVILNAALGTILSLATGYDIWFDRSQIGTTHAVFTGVHVRKNGDPVLDAKRVDVDYALRDIFPGGQHRYGFAAIAIQQPVLTLTRHADGTLTFNRSGGTSASPPAATKRAAAPLYFTARVRDGVIRLVDAAPLQGDLASQTVEHVSIDASIKSDARTYAQINGVLLSRERPGAPLAEYPLAIHSAIDTERGIALNRLQARALPLRGFLGFFIHSKTVRFDAGELDDVDLLAYGINVRAEQPFSYRLGGSARFADGQIAVGALQKPIRSLRCSVTVTDDTFSTTDLTGTIAGVPLSGRGAFYGLFTDPAFRLGIHGDAEMRQLRTIVGFAAKLPLEGKAHLEAALGSRIADPLIRISFSLPRLAYDRYPVDAVNIYADIYGDSATIEAGQARYGKMGIGIAGRVLFGQAAGTDVSFVMNAQGPGRNLPYMDAIAPDSTVDAMGLIGQPPGQGWNARGTIALGGGARGAGTFAVDQHGVGEFGPFEFGRADGSSLAGGFELERPVSLSAGWVHIRDYRLASVRHEAALPGARVPGFPPIGGVLNGDLVVGGTPDQFGLAGLVHARNLQYADYRLGNGSVRLGGTFSQLLLAGIALDGPIGRFTGTGAYGDNLFALDGTYDGSLEALTPFIGNQNVHGPVHGPVRAAIATGGVQRIVVQTTGARLPGARVRGIPVDRVAGTMAVDGKALRVIAADGSIGGGRIVVADAGGPFVVSAPNIPAGALRGTGIPLQSGQLALFVVADLRATAPRFDGSLGLFNGVAGGYPVSGGARVAFDGTTAAVQAGVAALGATYGSFGGAIDSVGTPAMAYDLDARVPFGDVGEMRRALRLPLQALEGSFSANVRVRGSGARPQLAGDVRAPEGSFNGLAFRDAEATLAATPNSIAAHDARVTVGSTHTRVDASAGGGAFSLVAHADDANLVDFDDYFDQAETLDGRGRIDFALANDGRTTRTSGRLDLAGLRYRSFPFGTTDATWSQRGGTVTGALNVRGAHGALRANGTLIPGGGDVIGGFRSGTYRVVANAQGIDLGTWLPPLGIQAPILGQVSARAAVNGRWPQLGFTTDATLANGSVYGFPLQKGELHARQTGDRIALANSIADFGFVRFDANGSFGLGSSAPLALSIHAQTADFGRTLAAVVPKRHFDVSGALQADARVGGTMTKPRVTLGFEATQARYASLAVPRILGNVGYQTGTLTVNDIEGTFAKGSALLTGTLPISIRQPGVRSHAPFSFTVQLAGLDLAPFAPFVPGPQTKLGGAVDGQLSVEGTPDSPRLFGDLTLANGSYVSGLERQPITNANARVSFMGTSVALDALHANIGGGTLDGRGRFSLPFENAPQTGYSLDLVAKNARIDSPEYGRGTIGGTVRLVSARPAPVLSGDLTLSNASIPFNTIYRLAAGSGGSKQGPKLPLPNLAFDLSAHIGRNVRIQSSIMDIGTTGGLALTGNLASPRLAGKITATPGSYFSTYNRVFRIQEGTVAFDPNLGINPRIDMQAYAHVTNPDPDPTRNAIGSADITVVIHGTADELASGSQALTFTSNPPYSKEQIIGLLLDASVFGAVNFYQQQPGVTLRGAPPITNPLLPPGGTPFYTAGTVSFNQEAFSILNGQVTQRLLAPAERYLIGVLGLTDLEVTVDYGGGVGVNALKQLGHRDLYATVGQTFTFPTRTTIGLTARPDAVTSIVFNLFQQNGLYTFTTGSSGFNQVVRPNAILPLTGTQGFTFQIIKKYP
jgi:hypothetical protein